MADSGDSHDLQEFLKPFNERASDAEGRLSRLEALLASKNVGNPAAANEDLSKIVSELQKKLDDAKAAIVLERERASQEIRKLAAENAKLQYRITHLVRALTEANCKLENQTR
ncbi:uncharacterized protein LOC122671214 isoform X1 [Telopea speciosissima]|uniref:uncharacterized protein LOC122671214 isoform X1 n=1 Tax=Telopea speciosissima TaxID=54955 RepID=UPI001CC56B76|nr:uncharacterized protein LOC122671214 isoform X1 [Telopea speciosissima]